jgi:hypothetical protein
MNFQTGIVSDVAPHPNTPAGVPPSLGTVKVLAKGPGPDYPSISSNSLAAAAV